MSAVRCSVFVDKNNIVVDKLHGCNKVDNILIYFLGHSLLRLNNNLFVRHEMSRLYPMVVCFTPSLNPLHQITLLYK